MNLKNLIALTFFIFDKIRKWLFFYQITIFQFYQQLNNKNVK